MIFAAKVSKEPDLTDAAGCMNGCSFKQLLMDAKALSETLLSFVVSPVVCHQKFTEV